MKNFKNIQSILGGYFAFCITVFEASDIFIEKLKIEGDYFNYILLFLIIPNVKSKQEFSNGK